MHMRWRSWRTPAINIFGYFSKTYSKAWVIAMVLTMFVAEAKYESVYIGCSDSKSFASESDDGSESESEWGAIEDL